MYNKLTRAGIPLRPGRKEQNTVNEIEKALATMSIDEKKELILFLDSLISAQEIQEHQDDSLELV